MPRRLLLPALLAAVATACGPAGPGGKNILVITMDTTRADFLGAYGSDLGVTPVIDGLAARGVVFEDAYAPMPQTLPSHSTLFTGLDPRQHLTLENTYKLAGEFRTLAEVAAERGYRTGAFIAALVLDEETGMDQGFERFDKPAGIWNEEREGHPPQRSAEEVTLAALDWADELDPEDPWMLWAHYYDPHGDHAAGFNPPGRHRAAIDMPAIRRRVAQGAALSEELDQATLVEFWAQYAAEIRYMDEQIGGLIDGLRDRGLLEDTLIVLVGDHGEGLYEHGLKAHGAYVWEELHRIPLIVVAPDGAHAGQRVGGRALLKDLEPTIKRLAMDLAPSRDGDLGIDLWASVEAGGRLPRRPVFLERPHFDEERVRRRVRGTELTEDDAYGYLAAVLMEDHKLIRHPDGTTRLYDLAADPRELRDLSEQDPALRDKLLGLLDQWIADNEVGEPGEGIEISDEKRRALEALGYLGGNDG